jgi:hypothetical protein
MAVRIRWQELAYETTQITGLAFWHFILWGTTIVPIIPDFLSNHSAKDTEYVPYFHKYGSFCPPLSKQKT